MNRWLRDPHRESWAAPVLLAMLVTMAAVAIFDAIQRYFPGEHSLFWSYILPLLGIGFAAGLTTFLALMVYHKLAEAAVEEVNARVRLSGELTNERMLMRTLMENTPDLIYFKDREGRFVRVSRTMAKMRGVKEPADLLGQKDERTIVPEKMAEYLAIDRKVMETGESVVGREDHVFWKDGRDVWISTTTLPWRDRNGRIIGTMGIARDITKRKQTEQALQRQFAFQRQLIDAMPVPIFHKDKAGVFQECNEAYARFTGMHRDDIIGRTVFDLAPPDLAQRYHEQDAQLLRAGGMQRYESQVLHADGTRHSAIFNKAVVQDDEGLVVGLVGAITDLTDLRQVQEALAQENRRREELEQIVNQSPAIVFLWRAVPGWPVEYASESIRQLGYTPEDFTVAGMPFSQIVHPEDLARVGAEVADYSVRNVNEFAQQYRIFNKRGDVRWIDDRTWIRRDVAGAITHYQGIVMDITDRIIAADRQAATMQGLRAVLEMTDTLIAAPDLESLYRRAVELSRTRLGLERTAILLVKGDQIQGTFGTNFKGQTSREFDHQTPMDETWRERLRPRKIGEKSWMIVSESHVEWDGAVMIGSGRGWVALTPIMAPAGPLGFFCNDAAISGAPVDEVKQEILAVFCAMLGNIIARQQAEEEQERIQQQQRDYMERADRLNSLGMLAAGMAHEINNPLQGMLSHLHAAQRVVANDESAAKSLRMVERGVDTIATLVRKLLILGRTQDQEAESADCCEAIEFVTQLLASQFQRSKVRIKTELQAASIVAAIPRRYLTQVLLNLLINARDAMPRGGEILLGARVENDHAEISIADAGSGIPADKVAEIFKPFYTTKGAKGSGLGLSVAESLVRSSHGSIEVRSQPGQTVFTLKVPLATRHV